MNARAYVGLGSNLGDREATLRSAVEAIARRPLVEVARASSIFETTAVGPSSEPFLNAALELRTSCAPRALLEDLHAIERAHGRTRRIRWDARTLDLDLLLYVDAGGQSLLRDDDDCTLPHPAIAQRDFVLAPLVDLVPEFILEGVALRDHLSALAPSSRTIERRLDTALLG